MEFPKLHVPDKYKDIFTEVLQKFPELRDTEIHVIPKKKHTVPYGTVPTAASLLKAPGKRVYHISILEEADPPTEQALFKNLSNNARKGVAAHELTHVVQFQKCSVPGLLGFVFLYPFSAFEKKIERSADRGAIERGYGNELYEHAVYIRSIPGYAEERPAINKNYLLPYEIAQFINKKKTLQL